MAPLGSRLNTWSPAVGLSGKAVESLRGESLGARTIFFIYLSVLDWPDLLFTLCFQSVDAMGPASLLLLLPCLPHQDGLHLYRTVSQTNPFP